VAVNAVVKKTRETNAEALRAGSLTLAATADGFARLAAPC